MSRDTMDLSSASSSAYEGVLHYHSLWAKEYDRRWACILNRTHMEALKELAPRPSERVLDVGCGTGALTLLVAKRLNGLGEIVGVDLCEEMLKVARERLGALPHVSVVCSPIETVDLSPSSFDAALGINVQLYLEDPVLAWRKIESLLKPKGRLVLISPWQEPFPISWLCNFFRRYIDPAHKRLYGLKETVRSIQTAGLVPVSQRLFHLRGCTFAYAIQAQKP